MKFTLDTQNKTITLLEDIELDELIALHADYKLQGYKVIPNVVSYINYQYPSYTPNYTPWYIKPQNPWIITNTLGNLPLTANGNTISQTIQQD